MSSRRIAVEMGISFHTVESFRKKLLQKFKVKTTIEMISSKFQASINVNDLRSDSVGPDLVKILTPREQQFITSLFAISEEKLSDDQFTVDILSRNIGMSRPQLYRKIVLLTGKSPNDFIRDLRMDKALSLIKQKAGNVSEIALEVGYNNPSYFARCFHMRYGCTPSRFIA